MRLGYFTMPMHPQGRNPTETLQEDREAIILADRLGFHDAFVGEHLVNNAEIGVVQPLAAIGNYNTGCVNRLRSGNWQVKEILEALEKSLVQARRAGSILQRVRDFLRKRVPDLAPCDLAAAVAEGCSIAGPVLDGSILRRCCLRRWSCSSSEGC